MNTTFIFLKIHLQHKNNQFYNSHFSPKTHPKTDSNKNGKINIIYDSLLHLHIHRCADGYEAM